MKTYSEANNEQPFDWRKALAPDCREMLLEDQKAMAELAQAWVTCACGNQCDALPRDQDGAPTDPELEYLGGEFYINVRDMHHLHADHELANLERQKALKTLNKIEARSGRLLKQMGVEV